MLGLLEKAKNLTEKWVEEEIEASAKSRSQLEAMIKNFKDTHGGWDPRSGKFLFLNAFVLLIPSPLQ